MPRSDAKELLTLEKRGVTWSRNRNFHLFAKDGPRRALALHRRLAALARFIRVHSQHGLIASRERVAGRYPVELRLYAPRIAATLVARLDEEELSLLARDPDIARILARLA